MNVDGLLELWRSTHAPEVSEVLDRVSPRLPKPLYPKSASNEVRQSRWLAAAKNVGPDTLATLLDTLHDAFSTDVRARLKLLATWGDDPRVSSALTRLWEQPAHLNVSTLFLWEALADLLEERVDQRSVERLKAVEALGAGWVALFRPHMRPVIPAVLAKTRERLEKALAHAKATRPSAFRALTADERTQLKAAVPAEARLDDVLADIWAHPDDVDRRLVYADLLQQLGDPRGEFIALQCLSRPTPAQQRLATKLLKQHGANWAGPLKPVCTVTAYERGFASEVVMGVKNSRVLSPLLGHPAWATVHTVDLAMADALELVVHPKMTRLFRIVGLYSTQVRTLARRQQPLPVRSLVCRSSEVLAAATQLASPVFAALTELQVERKPTSTNELAQLDKLRALKPGLTVRFGKKRAPLPGPPPPQGTGPN